MADPKIADTFFMAVDLDAGTYQWCACGESGTQPFCDKTQNCTEFPPRTIVLTTPARIKLCMCKRTRHAGGVCDGSHSRLPR